MTLPPSTRTAALRLAHRVHHRRTPMERGIVRPDLMVLSERQRYSSTLHSLGTLTGGGTGSQTTRNSRA